MQEDLNNARSRDLTLHADCLGFGNSHPGDHPAGAS
jgi:hypothetical protein